MPVLLLTTLKLLTFLPAFAAEEVDRDAYLAQAIGPRAEKVCARTEFPQNCFAFKDEGECQLIYKEELNACLEPRLASLPKRGPPDAIEALLSGVDTCTLNGVTNRLRLNKQFVNTPECEGLIRQASAPRWWGIAGGLVGAAIGGFIALRMIRKPKEEDEVVPGRGV